METSIQNYFWMVDRLSMEDDSRNKVNAESDTVTLSSDLQQQIENGSLFARLLSEMHRTYVMRTGSTFEQLKQPLGDNREENWALLIPQLRHYGISITENKASKLRRAEPTQITSLISTLYEIDTSPLPQGMPSSASQNKIGIKLDSVGFESALDVPGVDLPKTVSNGSSKQMVGHRNNGSVSQITLDPIDTSKLSSKKDASTRSVNEASDGVPHAVESSLSPKDPRISLDKGVLPSKKQISKTVRRSLKPGNLSKNDFIETELPESLDETLTSAQFILKSLMMAFEMSSRQAVGLLSDNHRYLYHTCIKGLKGGNFDSVKQWYHYMTPHAGHLVSLLEMETQNQAAEAKKPPIVVPTGRKGSLQAKAPAPVVAPPVKTLLKALNILKGGFFSKDEGVVLSCINLFQVIVSELNLSGGDIVGQTWDWFVQPSELSDDNQFGSSLESSGAARRASQIRQPLQKQGNLSLPNRSPPLPKGTKRSPSLPKSKKAPAKAAEDQNEFIELLKKPGLHAVVTASQRFGHTKESAGYLMLHFGKFNAVELFTEKLQEVMPQWSDYAVFCQDLYTSTARSEIAIEVLELKGVLSFWVLQSLKVAESQGEVTLDDRITSLVFLTEIWLSSDFMDANIPSSGKATLNILKRAARDIKQTLAIVAIELMFRLLETFARTKHNQAPTLYKTLTFILVEFYWEIEIRDLMLRHFIYLFKKLDTIPVAILCEPLLKQVQISQYHLTAFNVFDFEFFQVVSYHKKLTLQTALLMMDALTKIALSSVFYAKVAILTMRALIMRFSKQPELHIHWKESFRQMLSSLINIETTLTQHELAAKEDKSNFFNRLAGQDRGRRRVKQIRGHKISSDLRLTDPEVIAIKTNERLIVNLLERIVMLGNELLNEELRHQLIDAFMAIEQQLDVRSKPITFILQKYGINVDSMISHKISVGEEEEDNSAIMIDENMTPNQNLSPQRQHHQRNDLTAQQTLERTRSRSASKSPTRRGPNLNDPTFSKRQVETANVHSPSMKKAASQVRVGLGQKQQKRGQPRSIVSPKHYGGPQSIQPRSTSHLVNTSSSTLQLYDYQTLESATNLLRYRHFVKKHNKLFKEIFSRYEGNETKTSRVPKSQMTFDAKKKLSQVISSRNLLRLIKDFDLMPLAGGFITNLRLRQDIPILIKLINQRPESRLETKLPELSYDGFVEFLLQYCHQLWNVSSLVGEYSRQLIAVELSEKLLETMRTVNEEKKMMIPMRHFVGNDAISIADPDEQGVLALLNQKIKEYPDYPIPNGYKKVQEVVIEDSYHVPEMLGLPDSEKISLEILDQVFEQALGVHILDSVPVTHTIERVVVDSKKAFVEAATRNLRAQSMNSIDSHTVKALKKNASQASLASNSLKSSPTKSIANLASTPQILSNKAKGLESASFSAIRRSQNNLKVRPELKLAILQADQSDRERVTEVATILEDVLMAVETGQTAGFSLVEAEEMRQKEQSIQGPINRNASMKRSVTGSTGTGQPRYLRNYVSKKTQQRQKEIEEEEAKKNAIDPEERRKRANRVKDSLVRYEAYLDNQSKSKKLEKEQKEREMEQSELAKARANKHRRAQQERIKSQIREFNEKKEKEKQEQKAKEEAEQKAKKAEANQLLKKKNEQLAEELKKLHTNVIKQQEEKQEAIEKQGALPKVARRPTHSYVPKPKPANPGESGDASKEAGSTTDKKQPGKQSIARNSKSQKPPRTVRAQNTRKSIDQGGKKLSAIDAKKQQATGKKTPVKLENAKINPNKSEAVGKLPQTASNDSIEDEAPPMTASQPPQSQPAEQILTEGTEIKGDAEQAKGNGPPANGAAKGRESSIGNDEVSAPLVTDNYSNDFE